MDTYLVEETFVSFDGRSLHRTVVISGHIDMVGPFSLSSDVLAAGSIRSYRGISDAKLETYIVIHRRELSAAESSNSNIEGSLVVGEDKDTYPFDHFLKVNVTQGYHPIALMIVLLLLDWLTLVLCRGYS